MGEPLLVLPEINPNFETKELTGSEAEYRALKTAVHFSDLVHMITSPHAFMWRQRFQKPPTPQMKLGVLAHKAILEGADFLQDYIVEPIHEGFTLDGKLTTSANAKSVQLAKAEWHANLLPGQQVVTQAEYDKLGFMMESLISHKFVQEVFKGGRTEVRGQWLDPVSQIGCTYANDFINFDCHTWADLKTCQDPRDFKFRNSVESLRYDLQAYMYITGTEKVYNRKIKEKVWVAIQNVEPYEVRVHYVDPYYEESGKYEFRECMTKLKWCLKENKWPQGQAAIEMLSPSFFFKNHYDLRLDQSGAFNG